MSSDDGNSKKRPSQFGDGGFMSSLKTGVNRLGEATGLNRLPSLDLFTSTGRKPMPTHNPPSSIQAPAEPPPDSGQFDEEQVEVTNSYKPTWNGNAPPPPANEHQFAGNMNEPTNFTRFNSAIQAYKKEEAKKPKRKYVAKAYNGRGMQAGVYVPTVKTRRFGNGFIFTMILLIGGGGFGFYVHKAQPAWYLKARSIISGETKIIERRKDKRLDDARQFIDDKKPRRPKGKRKGKGKLPRRQKR